MEEWTKHESDPQQILNVNGNISNLVEPQNSTWILNRLRGVLLLVKVQNLPRNTSLFWGFDLTMNQTEDWREKLK